jgi:hypothetical protein
MKAILCLLSHPVLSRACRAKPRTIEIIDFYFSVVADEPRNLFAKKLTRERVVPIISANVSWLILGLMGCLLFRNKRAEGEGAGRFWFELNNALIKSSFWMWNIVSATSPCAHFGRNILESKESFIPM